MLAKVIAWAPTRREAALALAGALRSSRLHGVGTNRDLLVGILTEPEFLAGGTDTAYLERHAIDELSATPTPRGVSLSAVAAALGLRAAHRSAAAVQRSVTPGFRNVRSAPSLTRLADSSGRAIDVLYRVAGDHAEVTVDGVSVLAKAAVTGSDVVLEVDGIRHRFAVAIDGAHVDVDSSFGGVEFTTVDLLPLPSSTVAAGSLAAPMPGTVVRTEVAPGARVEAGDVIIVLEAMKMEHSVRAPKDGIVETVLVAVGDQVDIGQLLAVVSEEDRGENG
jgi:propionyl-CoA carboxylase alpha chain